VAFLQIGRLSFCTSRWGSATIWLHLSQLIAMNLRARKHTVAWLGLLAMWLIVFAPLVSQLIVSAQAREPDEIICSALKSESPATSTHLPVQLDACGYCNLLANHAPAPAPAVEAPQQVVRIMLAVIQPASTSTFIPLAAFPSGRPRDPPVVS
jgi:Protein of unknown function (DUF2946)